MKKLSYLCLMLLSMYCMTSCTEEKTKTQLRLRVAFLVKIGSTICCGKDFGRNPQLATLQLGCVFI